MTQPEIQYRPMPPQDEPATVRVPRLRPDRTIPHVERGQQHAGEEPAPGEVRKDVAVKADTTIVTEQKMPPWMVGLLRGLGLAIVPLLYGLQHALESHQIGYSWPDSLEAGVLKALPAIIIIITGMTGYGLVDEVRSRKV